MTPNWVKTPKWAKQILFKPQGFQSWTVSGANRSNTNQTPHNLIVYPPIYKFITNSLERWTLKNIE
jgi:hypothetical protein